MPETKVQEGKKRLGRPPKPKADAPEEHQGKKRGRTDPRRKCYSFYCTSDEILYLRSLLSKMRRFLDSLEDEPTETNEKKKEALANEKN